MDVRAANSTPDGGDFGDLASGLAEFSTSKEAEYLQRLEADKDLVDELMWRGYAGPAWEKCATRLVRYGLSVMGGWVRNGKIFMYCARRRRPVKRRTIPESDVDDLVNDTIGDAIVAFRDNVLVPGLWDPTRGASLSTYFVGQCVMCFPNTYRAWLARTRIVNSTFSEEAMVAPSLPNAQQELEYRQTLACVPEEIVNIGAGNEMGYSYTEIAEKMGSTPRAVETKRWRFKKNARTESR